MVLDRVKCPRCGRLYSYEEYLQLPRVRARHPLGSEPTSTPVCQNCGARFHVDRLVMKTYIGIGKGVVVEVSTVDLIHEHICTDGKPGCFYETMLFFHGGGDVVVPDDYLVARYRTVEEAIKAHMRIVEKLVSGKGYEFVQIPKLVIKLDEEG